MPNKIIYPNPNSTISGLDEILSTGGGGGAVESVNGQTGVVVLSKSNIDLGNVDNTSDLAKPVSTLQQAALDLKEKYISPANNQAVYVNYQTGSDTTGSGSFGNPFKSIQKATTQIIAYGDNGQNKPYAIMLLGARQIETGDVFLPAYTSIIGLAQRTTYLRINSGSLKPHSQLGTVSSWNVLKNLYIGGSTVVDWDLQALGGSNALFILENCTTTGTTNFKGRNAGGGDFLEMYAGLSLATWTLDSFYFQLQNWYFVGNMNITNTQSVTGMSGSTLNLGVEGNWTINEVDVYLASISWNNATATITTVGTVELASCKGLPPVSRRTLSGGTNLTNYDDASIVPYVAGTPTDWATSAPTDISTAIDRIASLVKTLNSGTAIP